MAHTSSDKLHLEHKLWSSEIDFWNTEIIFLKKVLQEALKGENDEEKNDRVKKYLNHLDHNVRFLNALTETIETHELFIREMMDFVAETDDIELPETDIDDEEEGVCCDNNLTDHEKTRKHLKKFRKRYGKLKKKVLKIVSLNE